MSGHHPTRAHASRSADVRPDGPPAARAPSASTILLSLLAAVVAGAVLGAVLALTGGSREESRDAQADVVESAPAAELLTPTSVQSFDPVGGSGLRDEGGTWRTQRYNSADFGRLKPGVGLVLDLGAPSKVTTMTVPSASAGLTVALLGGDEEPTGDLSGWEQAAQTTTTEGETVLEAADAGAHRYWMLWITALAPVEGGFGATVGTPTVEGVPAAD